MTEVTEDDRERARALLKPYMERRLSGFELADAIALALAETRERAEAPLRQAQILLDDAQKDHARIAELEDAEGIRWARMNARIAELQAKLEASRDCSGRYHKRIAKLEAENARLRDDVKWGKHNLELEKQARQQWQERALTEATS